MEHAVFTTTSTTNRSSITNGSLFRKKEIDGRSAEGRRFRDLVEGFSADFGMKPPGQRELALIRQAAALAVQSEALQAKIIRGEDVNLEQLTRLTNVLSRTLKDLGIRKARTEPKGVKAYLASKASAAT
jgi:hypothetical protein